MAAILSPGRYFGSVDGRYASGPFLLIETSYPRELRIPVHRHDRPYFCFVLQGSYRERAGSDEVPCRPDTVVFHPSGSAHEDRFGDDGGRCFNLECEASWLDDRDSGLRALSGPVYLRDVYLSWLARRLHHEARMEAVHRDLAIDGLARALVAGLARQVEDAADGSSEAQGPAWFLEAVALARRDYANDVGLADIARRVGVHPRHLSRTFRDRMGCTLGEFVRRRRVEAACRLLSESADSLSRIAYRTGFSDQSHLTRVFKRNVGTTPSEYRRRCR